MLVLIVSDTHGNLRNLKSVIKKCSRTRFSISEMWSGRRRT